MKTKTTNRRSFIRDSAILTGAVASGLAIDGQSSSLPKENPLIMTVGGPIQPDQLGVCLHHEHIVSRFGEDPESLPTYDYQHAVADVAPYLGYMKKLGCDSIMCCTTKYFGRDARLLQKISEESGMQLIANTGFYGAANDRYVPKFAFEAEANEIAKLWTNEFENGIDESDVKPGFIKVGVDNGPLSEIDAKLVRAGAVCHRNTGLTLQVHTGDNADVAQKQLAILESEGVSPSAWVWVHAQNIGNGHLLLKAAEKGAWISLDALRTANYYEQRDGASITVNRHLELLMLLRKEGFLKQVLLSHDGSSYPQKGKSKRTFEVLFTTFIPMMRAAGCSDAEISQLIVKNPRRAYTIRKRLI
jgi:predicted metal-dependent phosphotriesterase family hydrolase